MCTIASLKLRCRIDIESTIDTPPTGFFVKNHDSARICYRIGDEFKYINLATPIELAELLKKQGIIHFYSCKGDEVKMFERVLITITGSKGQPIQQPRLVQVKWEDINLSAAQVQTIAAVHELNMNKVVKSFINQVFKAAS